MARDSLRDVPLGVQWHVVPPLASDRLHRKPPGTHLPSNSHNQQSTPTLVRKKTQRSRAKSARRFK